jgi:hypothetical protein
MHTLYKIRFPQFLGTEKLSETYSSYVAEVSGLVISLICWIAQRQR